MQIPLKYKDRREEGATVLRQCQLAQLHLLHVVDAICAEYNIPYVLDGGTLLGAVRHDGFIPWDDDLDIGMMRRDYNRFLKIAKEALPNDVLLQTPRTVPERITPFSKLRDAYSFYAEQSLGISLARPNGIFIDIFPYDEVPNLGVFLERVVVKLCKYSYFYGRALRISGCRGWFWSLFGGWMSIPFFTVHYLCRLIFWCLTPLLPCKRVYHDLRTLFVFPFLKSDIFPACCHIFEDDEFPVPNNFERILTSHYGEWRQLPPESKRSSDHGRLILPFQAVMVPGALKW